MELGANGRGRAIRDNKAIARDMAESGLKVDRSVVDYEKGYNTLKGVFDYIGDKTPKVIKENRAVNKVVNGVAKAQSYLFREFHPNMKALVWNDMSNEMLGEMRKRGENITPEVEKNVKKVVAELVNDGFGGQNWDLTPIVNDPRYRKILYRVLGYADWTTSAAKQAANSMFPGMKGDMSRRYWMTFGATQLMTHAMLKFFTSGFHKNKEGNVRWSPKVALENSTKGDPSRWYHFPVMKDSKGKMIYAHFGKQAIEIKNWREHPFKELASKMHPVPSLLYELISGRSLGSDFLINRKYVKGEGLKPWHGQPEGTLGNYMSRLGHIGESFIPFSLRTPISKFKESDSVGQGIKESVKTFLSSGLGLVPLSTGMSPYKSHEYLVDAFRKGDKKMVNRIVKAMKENNHPINKIKAAVRKARLSASRQVSNKKTSF